MAHFPSSRLSRQELYSYGFKEGQPWGEDRRTLESALHAMDQLESEIQQNYIYARPAPSNPYAPSVSTPRHASAAPSGYFPPGRYPTPDIRMARSDASDLSSELSTTSSYSGRGYDYSTGYRDPVNYGSAQFGWRQTSPSIYQRSSSGSGLPQNFQSYPGQYFVPSPSPPPPSRISPSRSRNFYSAEESQNYPQAPMYYGSRVSNTSRGSIAANAPTQQLSPSQMQVVAYDGRAASDNDASDNEQYAAPTSPPWSMDTTRGTAFSERSMADTSPGMYSEDSAFSDVTRSSGYVESYDVASYGDYCSDYRNDSEDEHDYMSDDIASNEGEYYSSGEEPEHEDDGDDVYSDGGYSDSYDDGSYSSE